MPLLKTEAEKLSNNVLVAGVIEEIIERDGVFGFLPFTYVNGKAYMYDRELTLSEGDWLDPNDTVQEGAASFEEVVARLRILIGDVDVDNFLDETMSDTNNQTAIQIASKAKGIARKFHRTLALGNATSNPREFDGLPNLVSSDQTLEAGTNGSALTFEALDALLRKVPLGADALVMRGGTQDAIFSLMRQLGGATPEHITHPNVANVRIPTYRGIPILVNDFLAGDETQGSSTKTGSIYAVRFNEVDGLHGLYGGRDAGIRVESVGPVQNKDAKRYRLKWYTSVALKSTKSLARLKGITSI